MDMTDTIIPKSDQLNADDLIGRTLTITVTKVSIPGGEQPVSIHYEGDGGRPYRPGKSMRRVLVNVWGPDANAYVGRSMTLYRDDEVVFGGLKVGGIRISHMSHTDGTKTMALTATRGNKKAFTVQPLAAARKQTLGDYMHEKLDACRSKDEVNAMVEADERFQANLGKQSVRDLIDARRRSFDPQPEDELAYEQYAAEPADQPA